MGRKFEDVLKGFTPERRARIEANADAKHKQYLALKELRIAHHMTQEQIAETLSIQQSSVAKMEKGGDMLLSTLMRFIKAMGGTMEIVVTMPDGSQVKLERMGDLNDAEAPPEKRSKAGRYEKLAFGAEAVKPAKRARVHAGRVKASPALKKQQKTA